MFFSVAPGVGITPPHYRELISSPGLATVPVKGKKTMAVKVIVTGVTGMVGEGVLLECLRNGQVESVLAVCRKPLDLTDPKLKILLAPDFLAIDAVAAQLEGYDACFYCAGVSSNGITEQDYTRITYDTTLHFASVASQANPRIVFSFVSGYLADSSEQGRVMWARVKGKTENALMKMFPGMEYNFRPALMRPMPGQKHFHGYNRLTHKILYPILSPFLPACSIQQIAQAMINVTLIGYEKPILEVSDIKKLAAKRD
jgi:NAD dependent epimerase/dehydratase family